MHFSENEACSIQARCKYGWYSTARRQLTCGSVLHQERLWIGSDLLADDSQDNERNCTLFPIATCEVGGMGFKGFFPISQILIKFRDMLEFRRVDTASIAIPISRVPVAPLKNSNGCHYLTELAQPDKIP